MASILRTRLVETQSSQSGATLYQWGPASWRYNAPPDVFVLALDKAVEIQRWHKGPVPMPKITQLIPTLKQISALSHIVVDIRQPEYEMFDEAPPTWSQIVVKSSLSDRYYRYLPMTPVNANEGIALITSLVSAGRTPVLLGDRMMNIAPFANLLIAAGLTVGELDWQSAPAASERTSPK